MMEPHLRCRKTGGTIRIDYGTPSDHRGVTAKERDMDIALDVLTGMTRANPPLTADECAFDGEWHER